MLAFDAYMVYYVAVAPSQGRELKLQIGDTLRHLDSRPFTGAQI